MDTQVNKEKFLEWFEVQHNGSYFDNIRSWFNRTERNHKQLREFLGGVTKTIKSDIVETNVAADFDEVEKPSCTIYTNIPKFFDNNGLSWPSMAKPVFILEGQKRPTKWTKAISQYMVKNKVSQDVQNIVNKQLSILGEVWSKYQSRKLTLYFTLTTHPKAFVSIGHYGNVDNRSCFKLAGVNEIHKFMIGQTKNSFVGLVSSKPIDFEEQYSFGSDVLTRFWGIADPSFKAMYTFNNYPKTPKYEGSVLKCILEGFSNVLGDAAELRENGKVRPYGVYFNDESDKAYHASDFVWPNEEPIKIQIDSDHLEVYRKCVKCHARATKEKTVDQIEFGHYCQECIKRYSWKCGLTGELTVTEPNQVWINDVVVNVGYYAYIKHCERCFLSNKLYLKTDLAPWLNSAGYVHPKTAIAMGKVQCENCRKFRNPNQNCVCEGLKKEQLAEVIF